MRLLLPLLFLLSVLACNKPKAVAEKAYTNDTTEVLKMLIDSAIANKYYSSKLRKSNPFGDSIIVLSDRFKKYDPHYRGIKSKYMTKDEICNSANMRGDFPDIIQIRFFNDGDTLYTAALVRMGVFPEFKTGGSYYDPATDSTHKGNIPCSFESYCGMTTYCIRVPRSVLLASRK